MRQVRVTITGRVQGVGYRAFVEREAKKRGLAGWVRNRNDGSVEAVFAGEAEVVDAMLAACRQGPKSARVADVVVREVAGEGLEGFEVRATV